MTWMPPIKPEHAAPYRAKLSEIAEILMSDAVQKEHNVGLMGGKAGVVLFLFYYAQQVYQEKGQEAAEVYIDFAHRLIGEIFDSINNEQTLHTFAGGLAGVGWMMEHLAQKDFVEADTNEILGDLDTFLHQGLIYDIEQGNYDYLHGAVGSAAYFLHRRNNDKAGEYLREFVERLEKIAHRFGETGGIGWESVLDRDKGNKGFNISLSHGLASIIFILGKLKTAGIYNEKVTPLLNGAMTFLLANRIDPKQFQCYFPSWVEKDTPLAGSRLAWCYGDLGIGISLLQIARETGVPEWEKVALDALELTTLRTGARENAILDAGLCHGGAGLAHIYNRAFNATNNPKYKEMALYWAEKTLELAVHPDGFAGFKAWHTEKYGGWVAETGLLEGISGIGLMLISMLADIEPSWDRCLFIS